MARKTISRSKPHRPATEATKLRWFHNSLIGRAEMVKAQMGTIIDSSTATPEAKSIAHDIYALSRNLRHALAYRMEEGKIVPNKKEPTSE